MIQFENIAVTGWEAAIRGMRNPLNSWDKSDSGKAHAFGGLLKTLEKLRQDFNCTQDRKYWRALIELLPEGYRMRATVQLNYEVIRAMYHARKNHKLSEWHDFCYMVEALPYAEELIIGGAA